MSNSERIVSSFTNKELKTLVMAVRMYNMTTGRTNDTLLCKLVDSFLLSNELESEVIKPNPNAPMGSAEYKAYEAMYESDVRAHS
jgi:hypothetical protein